MATSTADKPTATSTATTTPAPVVKSSAEPNAKKIMDSISPSADKLDHPSSDSPSSEASLKKNGGSKTSGTTLAAVPEDSSVPVNDIQKKIRRAERFGVPVQMSEKEKRNSRAERFGTAPGTNGTKPSKQSEDLKRKARAERFGLSVPATAADEEAKRKARLARFAPYSKPNSVEEEKRQARALRFSNPPSSTSPHANGQGNIQPEAPIAVKAGEGP